MHLPIRLIYQLISFRTVSPLKFWNPILLEKSAMKKQNANRPVFLRSLYVIHCSVLHILCTAAAKENLQPDFR